MRPDLYRDALDRVPPVPLAAIRARAARPRHRRPSAILVMSAMVAAVAVLCVATPSGSFAQTTVVALRPTPVPGPTMT